MAERRRAAVVGAGFAGLACGLHLAGAGWSVQLFDKGRGPGGRMSTRRTDLPDGSAVAFDHGAQYLTAHDPAFAAELARWRDRGWAAPWRANGTGEDWWVGTPGMSAPVRRLAVELPHGAVSWGATVRAVIREASGWRLKVDGAADGGWFDAAVLALPAEQAAALAPDGALQTLAAGRRSDPCWTAMLAFSDRLPTAADVLRSDGDLAWAARNGSKPGRAPAEAWVLQASPNWSRAHLEDTPETVIVALSALLERVVGSKLPPPSLALAHRWRYARSGRGEEGYFWDAASGIGACGDWLLGPRVENAWLSGRQLAARMIGRS